LGAPPHIQHIFTLTRSVCRQQLSLLSPYKHRPYYPAKAASSFNQKRSNPENYLLLLKPEQEETADAPPNLTIKSNRKQSLNSACIFG